MSLICLSSRGVSDTPGNFTNYFGGRGIEFPKNSEICLVGASIRKHAPGKAVVSITPENNTFACHYGLFGPAAVSNLMRDDIYIANTGTLDQTDMEGALDDILQDQCTISPLRYGWTVNIGAGGITILGAMQECRNTLPGYWVIPKNLPFIANVAVANGATATRLIPTAGVTCWAEDQRKLWNVSNQGTAANFASELEGAKFEFTWVGGSPVRNYDGMQGGIVTGDRLIDAYEPKSWVNNPNQTDAGNPASDAYQQNIDLGYEIEEQRGRFIIRIFKNEFNKNSGYTRRYLSSTTVAPAAGDQVISILFRPIASALQLASWEVATKIGAAAWTQAFLVATTVRDGNFPIGHYNGNSEGVGVGLNCVQFWGKNNNEDVRVAGCYDDDAANASDVGALAYISGMYWAMSNISDEYAVANQISPNMRSLAQTRCNISDALGFYSGQVEGVVLSNAPGLVGPVAVANWAFGDTPLCIQLPNLPITGYLGGGASSLGGATALPMLGIVDGYQIDENPTSSISEPYTENWIRLINKDSFMVNELQVRITDLYGIVPDFLDNPSHVWVKIRAGRTLEKV